MKTHFTLNEILDEMKQEEKTTFGNLEDRTSMVVAQMRGVNTHDGCNEDVDIAVLEFEIK